MLKTGQQIEIKKRDEMGKKKRLPFKLGFVELSDGETVVNVGIHCRLLLTKVGR